MAAAESREQTVDYLQAQAGNDDYAFLAVRTASPASSPRRGRCVPATGTAASARLMRRGVGSCGQEQDRAGGRHRAAGPRRRHDRGRRLRVQLPGRGRPPQPHAVRRLLALHHDQPRRHVRGERPQQRAGFGREPVRPDRRQEGAWSKRGSSEERIRSAASTSSSTVNVPIVFDSERPVLLSVSMKWWLPRHALQRTSSNSATSAKDGTIAANAAIVGAAVLLFVLFVSLLYYRMARRNTRLLAEEKDRAERAFAEAHGEPGQDRVPVAHRARDTHAHERHHGHDGHRPGEHRRRRQGVRTSSSLVTLPSRRRSAGLAPSTTSST